MLKEIPKVRQIAGEPRRRWFDDKYFDLIVWFEEDDSVWGFQLCYDREHKPRALTWTRRYGYKHTGIDNGEHAPGASKASPVLVEDGLFDAAGIGERFKAAAAEMPADIVTFVAEKLRGFKL
jgi:hypothetical protein